MILDLLGDAYPDEQTLRSKTTMILGELGVFLILLILAVLQLRKTFRKELALNRSQRNFLMSVTHELRSPVAASRLNLQTLLKRDLSPQKQRDLLERTLRESGRLDELIENILMSTSLEEGGLTLVQEPIQLDEFTEEMIQELSGSMGRKHRITLVCPAPLHESIDRNAFRMILSNLVGNALKYSPEGSEVTVTIRKEGDHTVLLVADEGIGVPPDAASRIFDKFHREGNEEVRRTKGTGLGLYIVKRIAGRMDGQVSIASNTPKGTIFRVEWKTMAT